MTMLPGATLHHGDAIEVLPTLTARAVDFVYLDPPFFTQREWHGTAGAFTDRWAWNAAARAHLELLREHAPVAAELAAAIWGATPAGAYFGAMGALFVALRRVLKLTGSIWCHADDHGIHGLRILLDAIFGPEQALGLVIWKRTSSHNQASGYGRVHDTIAVVARSRATRWRLWRIARKLPPPRRPRSIDEHNTRLHEPMPDAASWEFEDGSLVVGDPCHNLLVDGFADDLLNSGAEERIGYPTQKPLALLERFVLAGTLRGDLVLDPTCGSGTAVLAAVKHGRRGIGIDRSSDAIAAATARLSLDTRKLTEARAPRATKPANPVQGALFV